MQNADLLTNLIMMAYADGHIDESELELLESRRRKWQVSLEEFDQLVVTIKAGKASIFIPESPSQRHDLLTDMALMMMADGRIDPDERALLDNAAARMGIHQDQLNEIIAEFTDGDDDLVLGEDG